MDGDDKDMPVLPFSKATSANMTGIAAQNATELTAEKLAEIKGRLIEKLTPELSVKPYAVLLHPEPAGMEAGEIRSRLVELGVDASNVKIFATLEEAQAFIMAHLDEILMVVNRLPGADLAVLTAGLAVQDIAGSTASFVPETARDINTFV